MTAPFEEFDRWRATARQQLRQGVPPADAQRLNDAAQPGLFDVLAPAPAEPRNDILIPKEFLGLARTVSCHGDPARWQLLYDALWRLSRNERHLLSLGADPLVHRLRLMEKAVRRDAHKTKAFVRFRLAADEAGEHYLAWHRPDHNVLPLVAPFFARRFAVMRWTIMTPSCAVNWDGDSLTWAAGAHQAQAPRHDSFEDLWRTYYRAIFNPARLKLKMMKREMPVRYWPGLPETTIIPQLLAEAPARVGRMLAHSEGLPRSAEDFMPADRSLPALRAAARNCQGCPLHRSASCTVFGQGPDRAEIMIVGEQPGDEEDQSGQPFVGPAGRMLERAMAEAGLARDEVYLTNAVKHFKFEAQGERRIHKSPDIREINACRPWLMNEISTLRPRKILALGVTAGRALLGAGFTLKDSRLAWHPGPAASRIRTSYHPAAILRAPTPLLSREYHQALVDDLRAVAAAEPG